MFNQYIIYNNTGLVPLHFRPPYGDCDDRVRAIANALGLRTVFWNQDSGDTSSPAPNSATAATVLSRIQSWFSLNTGFISLEHDFSPYTSAIGINAIKAIQSLGGSFTLKPQPVGQCVGLSQTQWYQYIAPGTSLGSGSTVTPGTPNKPNLSVNSGEKIFACLWIFVTAIMI